MARDLSCPVTGKRCAKTKREAEAMYPEQVVVRCNHCRWWHANDKLSRRAARRGRRRN